MPSDPIRGQGVLPEALRPVAEVFHSQVSMASEEVREWHLHHEDAVADPAGVLAAELGEFAEGRIDPARMASIVGVQDAPDPILHHVMALADDCFDTIVGAGDGAFRAVLMSGGDLRDAVRDLLANLGRAFAMGRAVQRARAHTFRPDDHHHLIRPWPFHQWAPSEKAMAPPVVVDLEGADLRAAGLAEFLEGHVRIVLRVAGQAPPAALARLVSPGVFVAQVAGAGAEVLADLVASDGPGVVALFEQDSGALPFRSLAAGRIEVENGAIEAAIERVSGERGQPGLIDLRHLEGLQAAAAPVAAAPVEAAPTAPASTEETPGAASAEVGSSEAAPAADVDRLAAWLLANLPADTDSA